MSKNVKPTQQSLAKWKRFVRYLKRQRQWSPTFSFGRMVEEVTTFTDSDWAGRKKNSTITKRRLDTARQSCPESIHAQAKYHCKHECRDRAVCSSIGSVSVERNCVVVEGSEL